MGGGYGHALSAFRTAFPDIKGKFIVEHLPRVPEANPQKMADGVEALAHDFFKPQPIKGESLGLRVYPFVRYYNEDEGARVYLLHLILHD